MAGVDVLVAKVAPTLISVLLLGETGVGTGIVAERIHRRSTRAEGPLMQVNCAGLSAALLESELFGYERGAFTGAAQPKPGLLEAAGGGTVFLDEVGEMPMSPASYATSRRIRTGTRSSAASEGPVRVVLAASPRRSAAASAAEPRARRLSSSS